MADNVSEMKLFYDLREKFFSWVQENTEIIYKENTSSGFTTGDISGADIINPYVRLVARLKPQTDREFQKLYAALINAYKTAFPENKTLPLNFPKLFANVERITVYENKASEHKVITKKNGSTFIKWQTTKKELADEVEKDYIKSGLTYVRDDDFLPDSTVFKLDVISILKKYKAKRMVLKRESGSQYRCRVKLVGEKTDNKRYQFGFILLDSGDTEVEVRKTRNAFMRADLTNRLRNETILDLPHSPYHIFIEE